MDRFEFNIFPYEETQMGIVANLLRYGPPHAILPKVHDYIFIFQENTKTRYYRVISKCGDSPPPPPTHTPKQIYK